MEKYKKLVNNSILFAIGNLGSKMINILLVPLYTFYLTTAEYGTVDLMMTTISLCLPILSLSVYDSVFRFTMDKDVNRKKIISNALAIAAAGIFLSVIIFILNIFFDLFYSEYLLIMLAILSFQVFNEIFSQFLRAIGKINLYVLNSLLLTLVIAGSNLLFLTVFRLGVEGYLYSILLANILSFLFLLLGGNIRQHIDISLMNKNMVKMLLMYSIPLIPNSIMWWLINSSTRYFIFYYIDATANGLFAVASKIPSLLSIATTIFFQAWQLSAVEEFNSNKKSQFYSKVFKYYSQLLFLFTSLLLIILKPVMSVFVENSFFESWKIVPLLLLSVVYSSFATFLGTNYVAAKKTTGVFTSSVISALLSLICNIAFIPIFGIQGAGLSSLLSFFIMWIIRIFDTKKYIYMKIDVVNLILNNVIILAQIIILFLLNNIIMIIIELCLFLLLMYVNKELGTTIFNIFRKKGSLLK